MNIAQNLQKLVNRFYSVFNELNLPVTVASDDKVEYQGRFWSFSAFTREFPPEEERNTSGAYQDPKYFSYEGKTLSELRKEKKQNNQIFANLG